MPELEGPDDLLPLGRAAALSQVPEYILAEHAACGRLPAVLRDGDWRTTRRWVHVYLLNDLGEYRSRPLPPNYVAPDGEPKRKLRQYSLTAKR